VSSNGQLLAGDIGGTKTVLALYGIGPAGPSAICEERYASRDFDSFDTVLAAFLESCGRPGVAAACIDVAGPVVDGRCHPTNLPWALDEIELTAALGGARVKLLNDLEATAFGMLHLPPSDVVTLNEGTRPAGRGHVAVIAAGTGLGEAYLIWDGRSHLPLASEGGHADFAPRNEEEMDLLRYLRAKVGGRVSAERVLSGPGVYEIYSFLRDSGREQEPEWLRGELARGGDPSAIVSRAASERSETICVRTMNLFSELYGAEAGNMALQALSYGGVFVGGGIAPKNIDVLRNGSFLRGFTDKGRFSEMLRSLPVKVSLEPNAALLGSVSYAARLAAAS
jgi:glucokinase